MKKTFTIDENISKLTSINEVLNYAGLNWTVKQEDVYLETGIRIPNTRANVREDNGIVLGIVTNRYNPVQNKDAFDFIDDLTDNIVFENAGTYQEGKTVYIQADLDTRYIPEVKDEIKCKLVFTNGHDGMNAVKANIIPIVQGRPLNLKLHSRRTFNAMHTKKVEERMALAKSTLDLAKNYLEELMLVTHYLGEIKITKNNINQFVEALFPAPANLSERAYNGIQEKREMVAKRVTENTALGLLLAVSDYIDNEEPQRKTAKYEENRYYNVISGLTILDKAYSIINTTIVRNATK